MRRFDLHGSSLTGEDLPDGQDELNLLVEFLPLREKEYPKLYFALEEALERFFGREVGLLRTDDIKLESLRRILTRRRTLLYAAQDQDDAEHESSRKTANHGDDSVNDESCESLPKPCVAHCCLPFVLPNNVCAGQHNIQSFRIRRKQKSAQQEMRTEG